MCGQEISIETKYQVIEIMVMYGNMNRERQKLLSAERQKSVDIQKSDQGVNN
jgi:hypothetical protein